MEFQLSQAKMRAVLATISIIWGAAIPFFGYLGYNFVEGTKDSASSVSQLSTQMAVLNVQMMNLREDVQELKTQTRTSTSNALFYKEGNNAEIGSFTSARVDAKEYSR